MVTPESHRRELNRHDATTPRTKMDTGLNKRNEGTEDGTPLLRFCVALV